eukprot:TRINITY_DN7268_c0_g1_i2.p1 TRINITY_DN7268_c0_g1~~TRINITY_DN7268_c0_g1_i2.p1  ORF type:complete len:316 (+),score=55.17 TRINITY_DN7268_c0_g1_i2:135-1082(+)
MALDRRGEQLREAACAGDWEAVTSLLHAGVNPNDQNKVNGWTAMHWAAKRGHAKTLQILLANGGDLKVENTKGDTPADVAEPTCASVLKAAGVSVAKAFKSKPSVAVTAGFKPSYMAHPEFFYAKATEDRVQGDGTAVGNNKRKQNDEASTEPSPSRSKQSSRPSTNGVSPNGAQLPPASSSHLSQLSQPAVPGKQQLTTQSNAASASQPPEILRSVDVTVLDQKAKDGQSLSRRSLGKVSFISSAMTVRDVLADAFGLDLTHVEHVDVVTRLTTQRVFVGSKLAAISKGLYLYDTDDSVGPCPVDLSFVCVSSK